MPRAELDMHLGLRFRLERQEESDKKQDAQESGPSISVSIHQNASR
jgi:hypothetical protein